MPCKMCGKELPEGGSVCQECGEEIEKKTEPSAFSEEEWKKIDGYVETKETEKGRVDAGVIERFLDHSKVKVVERICIHTRKGDTESTAVTEQLFFEIPGGERFCFNDILPPGFKLQRLYLDRDNLERLVWGQEKKGSSKMSFSADLETKKISYSGLEKADHVLALFHEWGHTNEARNISLGHPKIIFHLERIFSEEQTKTIEEKIEAEIKKLVQGVFPELAIEDFSEIKDLLVRSIVFEAVRYYHSRLMGLLGLRDQKELEDIKKEAEQKSLEIAEKLAENVKLMTGASPTDFLLYTNSQQHRWKEEDRSDVIGGDNQKNEEKEVSFNKQSRRNKSLYCITRRYCTF